MKKLTFLFLFVLALPTLGSSQDNYVLELIVKEFDEIKGNVRICLADSKEGFMKKCFEFKEVPVTSSEMKIYFQDVPPGEYAISLFHDEDSSGKINTDGFLGLPSEDYGFSNNPRILLSIPKYRDCSFKVDSDKTVTVKLK